MNIQIFDRAPLVVIDTATNTYTRYIGSRRAGQWRGDEYSLKPAEVEALRCNPAEFFGEGDPRGAA